MLVEDRTVGLGTKKQLSLHDMHWLCGTATVTVSGAKAAHSVMQLLHARQTVLVLRAKGKKETGYSANAYTLLLVHDYVLLICSGCTQRRQNKFVYMCTQKCYQTMYKQNTSQEEGETLCQLHLIRLASSRAL